MRCRNTHSINDVHKRAMQRSKLAHKLRTRSWMQAQRYAPLLQLISIPEEGELARREIVFLRSRRRRHCTAAEVGFARRSTFSYDRLPQPLLCLSIVRLDGSSFDVTVLRSASVGELKLAVEEIFSGSPGSSTGDVSCQLMFRSHVWGHFCLCHMNQKMTDDKISLQAFGVKDGDKLHFIRRQPINTRQIRHLPWKNK
ncbi:uncharacterized protein LOC144713249 isoform X2 [Wolffia australiana]